jgi:Ni,Fe-hydrogenase I cytochrome b subunit
MAATNSCVIQTQVKIIAQSQIRVKKMYGFVLLVSVGLHTYWAVTKEKNSRKWKHPLLLLCCTKQEGGTTTCL